MGTCASKCCFATHPNPPQDRLIVSQSPPPPPPPPPYSSSSSSTSSSSTLFSTTSDGSQFAARDMSVPFNRDGSKIHVAGLESVSSTGDTKCKPSHDGLSVSNIIVLDPRKFDFAESDPRRPSRPTAAGSKRDRSASPAPRVARQKSWRGEHTPALATSRAPRPPSNRKVQTSRSPCNSVKVLEERIDNPLITMECFIFL